MLVTVGIWQKAVYWVQLHPGMQFPDSTNKPNYNVGLRKEDLFVWPAHTSLDMKMSIEKRLPNGHIYSWIWILS